VADSPQLPGSHSRPLDARGGWSREWYGYLRSLTQYVAATTDNSSGLADALERITALEAGGSSASIVGQNGVRVEGSLAGGLVRVLLEGATASPSTYYGMDASGALGFYARTLATLSDVDLTGLADGDTLVWSAGTSTFVPGEGGGASLFTRIDAAGDIRITASGDLRITD
jgi:hypothetical protein